MTDVGDDGREITWDLLSAAVSGAGLEDGAEEGSVGGADALRAPPLGLGEVPSVRLTGAKPESLLRSI